MQLAICHKSNNNKHKLFLEKNIEKNRPILCERLSVYFRRFTWSRNIFSSGSQSLFYLVFIRMGKARGVARRRRKAKSQRYVRSKKLKQVRKRELRKGGSITNDVVRAAWDDQKSLKANLSSMGLSHDPNKLLSGPRLVDKWSRTSTNDDSGTNMVLRMHQRLKQKRQKSLIKKTKKLKRNDQESMLIDEEEESPETETVADKLATMALQPSAKNFRFGPENIKFCAYMIEKYDNDYESMSRDKLNRYQESAGQIRAKIRKFLSIDSHRRAFEMARDACDE